MDAPFKSSPKTLPYNFDLVIFCTYFEILTQSCFKSEFCASSANKSMITDYKKIAYKIVSFVSITLSYGGVLVQVYLRNNQTKHDIRTQLSQKVFIVKIK